MKKNRILLTGIVGPFGVSDKYAEGHGMIMEPASNQVTREQDVHTIHSVSYTTTLYYLAQNISTPSTVLDFPTWKGFKKELKKGYTHIGISFIQANVWKAKRMARHVRRFYPDMKIILGGYGAEIPHIRDMVSCDEVVKGEGVSFLREYFNEKKGAPLKPLIWHASKDMYSYGLKLSEKTDRDSFSVLAPGLGCKNGCFFCCTSNKWDCKYIPLLKTGKDVFDCCVEAERRYGTTYVGYIEENFLKDPKRAREMQELMEKEMKPYSFAMWSSAEAILELGLDFMVRHGVKLVWIGVESKKVIFDKVKGIDTRKLVSELQARGISVLTSSILYLDHHNEHNLDEDIDWAISHGADLHQFLNLVALYGTPLQTNLEREGRFLKDFPYRNLTAQHDLNFIHKNFPTPPKAKKKLTEAFRRKYLVGGPASVNVAMTCVRGYLRTKKDVNERENKGLVWDHKKLKYVKSNNPQPDKFMRLRIEKMQRYTLKMRPMLLSAKVFSPNRKARNKVIKVQKLFDKAFGKQKISDRIKSIILLGFAAKESILVWHSKRVLGRALVRQPTTVRKEYNS